MKALESPRKMCTRTQRLQLTFLMVAMLLSQAAPSQSAYWDALFLKSNYALASDQKTITCLNKYRENRLIDYEDTRLNTFQDLKKFLHLDPTSMNTWVDSDNENLFYQIHLLRAFVHCRNKNHEAKVTFIQTNFLAEGKNIDDVLGCGPNPQKKLKELLNDDLVLAQELPCSNKTDANTIKDASDGSTVMRIDGMSGFAFGGASSPSPGGLGAVSFASIVDATAQFLVERTKEELTIAFFDKFRARLKAIEELPHLLPETNLLLQTADPFQIPSMGKAWEAAFFDDLSQMPNSFEKMVYSMDKYSFLLKEEAFGAFQLAWHIAEMHKEGYHPAQMLTRLNLQYQNDTRQVMLYMRLMDLISRNLLNESTSRQAWIKPAQFLQLDQNGRRYFLMLTYVQDKPVFQDIKLKINGTDKSLEELLGANLSKAEDFARQISGMLHLLQRIDDEIERLKNLQNSEEKTPSPRDYISITEMVLDLTTQGARLGYSIAGQDYYQSDYSKKYQPIIQSTLETVKAYYSENYGFMVSNGVELIKSVLKHDPKLLRNCTGNISTGNPIAGEKWEEVAKRDETLSKALEFITFYGGFMVDIVTADSADAKTYKRIIQKYAAPVESYKIKRKSLFSLEIGAYPGIYSGAELGGYKAITTNSSGSSDTSNAISRGLTYGVTAPIGITLSWGVGKSGRFNKYDYLRIKKGGETGVEIVKPHLYTGHSLSIFLPIVDIGAAFSYRFSKNDSTAGFPNTLSFKQFFSPGLHLVWGVKNTPLAIMLGGQYAPLLRDIKGEKELTFATRNVFRISATLSVDIPVFNLFHSTEPRWSRFEN